jgi:hypothetical protein
MSLAPIFDPLSVLLGVMQDPGRAAWAASSPREWEEVKRLAQQHGLAGVLAHLCGDSLPAGQQLWVKQVVATQLASHHRRLKELKTIAEALDAEGIRFVALKGPVLGERYLHPPSMKVSGDLDLLVDEANLWRAGRCLIASGWREEDRPSPWWVWRQRNHHIAFKPPAQGPASATVELHFRLPGQRAPIGASNQLDRSVIWTGANGLQVRVLEPADEAIFLAIHAAGHFFARLAWLYDARMVFRTLSAAERGRVLALARRGGKIAMLSAANRASIEFFDEPLLGELPGFPAWPEFRRAAIRFRRIDGQMRWRERWAQRVRLRRLWWQMTDSPRDLLALAHAHLLLPLLEHGWRLLRGNRSR